MTTETTIADQETLARQEAAIAALILLRSQKSLPYPQFRIYSDEQISLEFGPIAELEAWAGALQGLGAAEGKLRTGVMHSSDRPYHFMNMDGWLCRVTLRAYEQRPEPTPPLDADTVAGLEAVVDDEPRCPSCGEPWRLLRSGAVGHAGDHKGNDCEPEADERPSKFAEGASA